jgi:hypothetical protein
MAAIKQKTPILGGSPKYAKRKESHLMSFWAVSLDGVFWNS